MVFSIVKREYGETDFYYSSDFLLFSLENYFLQVLLDDHNYLCVNEVDSHERS